MMAAHPGGEGERAMSIFGSIMKKIFRSPAAAAAPAREPASAGTPGPDSAAVTAPPPQGANDTQAVDVGAVLAEMAAMKGGGGNYQSSIVDLLKLLDLDSSLDARKELGEELGVNAGDNGSAEQNIALHKAVMAKLADNGGLVPDSLRN
jgi:hypothetical protein